ncbi:hypothetical protein D9M68_365510 [compost metagenome]
MHTALDQQMCRYRLTNRGRYALSDEVKHHMDEPMSLNATNLTARLALGKAIGELFPEFFSSQDGEMFFVTLTEREHAVPLAEAANFDINRVTDRLKQILGDASHFGAVDVAYYPAGIDGVPTISWHAHALVWETTRSEISVRAAQSSYDSASYLPGCRWLDIAPAMKRKQRALYTVKGPVKEYYAYPVMREVTDMETGELVRRPTGRFKQKKRRIRPGHFADLSEALSQHTLPDLLTGAGEGTSLREELLADTIEHLRRQDNAKLLKIRQTLGLAPP